MKAIIAHPNLDFDALASMVAAQKLYPGSVLVTTGKLNSAVRAFMALYGEIIEIKNYIDKNDIDTLIMVDTRSKKRLNEFIPVAEREGISVIVYDHHNQCDDDVPGAEMHLCACGANVTQLVGLIRERNIPVSSEEATVMMLGIYDDTGSLRFSSTVPEDILAAAWLLEQGANLDVVTEYTSVSFTGPQSDLFRMLLSQSKIITVHEKDILFSRAEMDCFVTDLGILANRLRETFSVDAVFVIVRMENKVFLVGRSSSKDISVRDFLAPYGGRGHIMAASANLKNPGKTVDEFADELMASAGEKIAAPSTVSAIMTTPVKTLRGDMTINEVSDIMLRCGHSGYPVMEDGRLIGIISRRDVEKSRYHGLGNVPVKGYMCHNVVTCPPDMTLEEARALMIERNIGRLPVVKDGELVGIVSRTDLLEFYYGFRGRERGCRTYTQNPDGRDTINLLPDLKRILPGEHFWILDKIAYLADSENISVYLVGGLVRDLLMNRRSVDLDFVVEGDGIAFAQKAAVLLGGELSSYGKFGTATVTVNGVIKIDIAGARTEFYEYPAAKPEVERSSLKQDLFRRDFTVNAMALTVGGSAPGTLIDYYNGRQDLESKTLRVLHNLSFVEDPTRIFRALRFAGRYGFELSEETLRLAEKAVSDGLPAKLSLRRIWHEIYLILQEENAFADLDALNRLGLWKVVFPGAEFNRKLEKIFGNLPVKAELFRRYGAMPSLTLVRFLLMIADFDRNELEEWFVEAQIPVSFRRAYNNIDVLCLIDSVEFMDRTDIERYDLMNLSCIEAIIAYYMLSGDFHREHILDAYRFYMENRFFCSDSDIRQLDGFSRGMLPALRGDLLSEKQKGMLRTAGEELAFLQNNLLAGKYKTVE